MSGASTRIDEAPIAIVGIGCRYPGAEGPQDFWRLLIEGRCAVTDVPASRWDPLGVFDAEKQIPRRAAFLRDVRSFDAEFFKIAPREAEQMDPQQRLLLEVSWEAMEDAGFDPWRPGGARTGVYVGAMWHDYEIVHARAGAPYTPHSLLGQTLDLIPARVSFAFGFRGPSMLLNTGCSSTLVTLHLACQAIRRGECDRALVGGTSILLAPDLMVGGTWFGGLAPDGVCKAFSAAANGFGRGEGAAVVVLRPLAAALADGDRIYCVIRAAGVNNDGGGRYLTSPNVSAQRDLLRELYASAGVDPLQIEYVEAHGTGTRVGDPVEAQALGEVLGRGRDRARRLRIGSVKTNIGHQEGGAGVAGLIKVALSLFHHRIPPSLHSQPLNPQIDFEGLGLEVQSTAGAWDSEPGRALAGVSAFGWGGTNAHVIVQAAPAPAPRARSASPLAAEARPERILVVTAATASSLRRRAGDLATLLEGRPDVLDQVSATLARRRAHLPHRLAVAGAGPSATSALRRFATSGELAGPDEEHGALALAGEAARSGRKVVFVFPGQGSQWLAMGRRLREQEPVFAAAIDRAGQALRPFVDWSLERVLADPADGSWLEQVEVIQCALWAMQVALAALWRSWGVEPHAVVGHSMGEVAAACVAGAIGLDDGARIVATRSGLARRRSGGGMLHVALSEQHARAALAGYEGVVSVAVCSSPRATVLSGDRAALEEIEQRLLAQEVFCRPVRVDYASHSPQMDGLLDELRRLLAPISPQAGAVPLHSTVVGRPVDGAELGPDYWARNLRDPVRFAEVIGGLARDGHTLFLEVSPHPLLVPSIEENLQALGIEGTVVATLRRGQGRRRDMLERFCELQVAGAAIEWGASELIPEAAAIDLPAYPWDHRTYWVPEPKQRALARTGRHALLRESRSVATPGRLTVVQARLAVNDTPFLQDHVVLGAIVFPAAGYIDLALAAAREVYPDRAWAIEDLRLDAALTFGAEEARMVQVLLEDQGPELVRFSLASTVEGDEASGWTWHVRGRLLAGGDGPIQEIAPPPGPLTPIAVAAHYEALQASGLSYGPSFRRISALRAGTGYAEGVVETSKRLRAKLAMYCVHPAMLDAALQVAAAAIPQAVGTTCLVPTRFARVKLYRSWPERVNVIARSTASDGGQPALEILVCDPEGGVVMHVDGMELTALSSKSDRTPGEDLFIESAWRRAAAPGSPPATATPGSPGRWAIVDLGGHGSELARELTSAGQLAALAVHVPGRAPEDRDHVRRLDVTRREDVDRWIADLAARADAPLRGVVVLGVSEGPPGDEPDWPLAEALVALLAHTATALGELGGAARPKLVVITGGAQAGAFARPEWAAAWGVGRVIEMERPDLPCVRIDLASDGTSFAEVTRDLLGAADEREIAYLGGERFVARLEHGAWGPEQALAARRRARIDARQTAYQLETVAPGSLEHLSICAAAAAEVPEGRIRVEVDHASLNFIDLMAALGIYPAADPSVDGFGLECSGRIVAIGRAVVTPLAVGDEVVVTPSCSFRSIVDARPPHVIRKPAGLSSQEAAAYSGAVMTAWYGLHHLARIRPGERVLVHAGAGGLGLAAIDIARRAGLEVFATAGSEDKRAYLRELGVAQVFDSRSIEFARQIRQQTGGEGVDVVLNSLQGELMDAGLGLLRFGGRFLEVGKRDIYSSDAKLPLHHFRKAIAMFAIDLKTLRVQQPERFRLLLEEVTRELEEGRLSPPTVRCFPASAVRDAFEHMARAEHVGKIVVDMKAVADVAARALPGGRARGDGVYLISGGLGALGRAAGEWLAAKGAGRIVLIGRGEPTAEAQASLHRMRELGARVDTVACDVGSWSALEEALRPILDGQAVRGVVHAAGVLEDATLANLEPAQVARVFHPKVRGAWNLHRLTAGMPLDFFVLYSSLASLFGSAGQAAYAAANACLDALARYRLHRGLPATSINWGPVGEVGLAARAAVRGERLAALGMAGLTVEEVTSALERVLADGRPQVGVARLDAARWRQAYPGLADSPRWSALLPAAGAGSQPRAELRARLETASPGERLDLVEAAVRTLLSQVLRLTQEQIDRTTPFGNLGLDSLLGLELRARLERTLGISLPITALWQHPTLERLAGALLERAGLGAERPPAGEVSRTDPAPAAPAAAEVTVIPDRGEAHQPFGLTDLQHAYLIGRAGLFELGNVSTCFLFEFDLAGLDLPRLEWSLGKLIERHGMLRAVVLPEGVQQVLPRVPPYAIEVGDLRSLDAEAREQRLLAIRDEMAAQSFDTARWPLFRVRASQTDGRRVRVHFLIDALIADGWSMSTLFREWVSVYRSGAEALPPLSLTYRDYVSTLAATEHTPRYAAALAYWRARLPALPPPPDLPLVRQPGSIERPVFLHWQARLGAESWAQLKQRAFRHDVTLAATICTAYAEVLAAWSRSSHFTLNVLVQNRPPIHPEVSAVIGNFSATTLLEVELRDGASFAELARRLQHQLWSDLEHNQVSGVRVLRELNGIQQHAGRAGMPVVFSSMLNFGGRGEASGPGLLRQLAGLGDDFQEAHCSVRTPQVWLDHQVLEDAGELVLNWDVVEELFPPRMIADMFEAYLQRLEHLAADDAAWLAATPPLVPRAQLELRAAVNETAAPLREALLHAPFLERAAADPTRVAVISHRRTLTYGELDQDSDRVASWLREAGARPDRLVAIVMEKGWEQVVAAVAVLKAGAAYVPVDPSWPTERVRHLLAHAEADCVLTQRWIDARVDWPAGVRRLCVDEAPALPRPAHPLAATARPGDLAYVIYTSGSTGVPKGVMIEHRAALNTILDVNQRFGIGKDDRVLGLSSFSFDLSVYDVFGMLAAGGALVLPAAEELREPGRWVELIASSGVTIWNSVPALMEMLVDHCAARTPGETLPLRWVMMSGDWIPLGLVPRIPRIAPRARSVSLGGATEASIWSILHPIEELDPEWTSVPYGRPMRNQRFEVLDRTMRSRPVWVAGDLYIAGAGLARGYWRDEEKTAASFPTHPQTGERLYRTGDLGRYFPDGSIEFLGRADFQVKINGYRVELGEIEAALAQEPGVRAAAAAAPGERGARRLVAYVVPAPGASLSEPGLIASLAARLPGYAVPQQVVLLDALPLSANGKVDRRALPEPGLRAADRSLVPARTQTEQALVALWRELLGVEELGIRDNFFELGGQSLLAVRLMGQLHQRYGISAPLATLFERPTIEGLAQLIDARAGAGPQRRDALVVLRDGGRRPPLFFVHPVGGDVLCYAELARAMGPEQPFFGLQALDPGPGEDPAGVTVPDMAEAYAAVLRKRQASGPYFLGGWSMGGVVAYELAQRLRGAGAQVGLLALVDVGMAPSGERPQIDDASLLVAFGRDLAGLAGRSWDLDADGDRLRRLPAPERLDHFLARAREHGLLPDEMDRTALDGYFARFRRNYRAMLAYQATRYDGRLLFLRARQGGASVEAARAWSELSRHAEIVELDGDHHTIMRRDRASELADLIGARLRAAGAEDRPAPGA